MGAGRRPHWWRGHHSLAGGLRGGSPASSCCCSPWSSRMRADGGETGRPGRRITGTLKRTYERAIRIRGLPVIATQRLRLRQMTRADAPAVWRFQRPAVTRFLGGLLSPPGRGEALWTVQCPVQEHAGPAWASSGGQDTVIGTCRFHRWDQHDHHVEIGYDLGPAYWGRGYQAVHALVGWCLPTCVSDQADCVVGSLGLGSWESRLHRRGVWQERHWCRGATWTSSSSGSCARSMRRSDQSLPSRGAIR